MKKTMNHKPGSVTKSYKLFVLEYKLQDFSDCHLSWTGFTADLLAVYPQHWTGRPAAA